jgi:hypothetical protein
MSYRSSDAHKINQGLKMNVEFLVPGFRVLGVQGISSPRFQNETTGVYHPSGNPEPGIRNEK